jgi:hypothetical protein
MSAKAEISWKRRTPEGERREFYAQHVGKKWVFHVRGRRFEQWEPLPHPPLEDWLELLDAVRRRAARRLLPPDVTSRLEQTIRELFPEAEI